jgi:hypothetical protein
MWPIRQNLGLRNFSVTDVGAIQELEESTENYVIPITVGWAYEHVWQLKRDSLPVQGFSFTGVLDGDKVSLNSRYQGP